MIKNLKCFAIIKFIFTDFVQVQLEDVFSSIDVWVRHVDFLVETSGADCSRVQSTLVVRRSDHHDVIVLLEAVHFCQDLIQSGPTRASLVASTART